MRRFPSDDPYDGSADDAPIAKLWMGMIIDCLREGDERMHVVPPNGDYFIVRAYRDGSWRDVLQPPSKMYRAIMQRLKVMASSTFSRKVEEGRFEIAYRDEVFEIKATVRTGPDGLQDAMIDLPELPPNKRLKLAARVH